MITPDALIQEARTWVGVPFLHQGRSREGVDCVGLVIVVGRALGILPRDFERTAYGRVPHAGKLLQEIAAHCVSTATACPGSLLVLRWQGDPHHIAICTGANLIHANARVGRVVEHGYRHPWPKLTQSVWRMPGVEYVDE